MKLGCGIVGLAKELEQDFWGTMNKLAEYGYTAVEPLVAFGEVSALQPGSGAPARLSAVLWDREKILNVQKGLRETGLAISSMHAGFAYVDDEEKAAEELAAIAEETGIRIFAADLEFHSRETCKQAAALVNRVNRILKAHGAELLYHNHAAEFGAADEAGKTWMDVFLELTDPDVRLQVDAGWALYADCNPAAFVEKYRDRVASVHIKDICPAFHAVPKNEIFTETGKGVLPCETLLELSRELNLIEHGIMVDQDGPAPGHAILDDLKNGAKYLQNCLPRKGYAAVRLNGGAEISAVRPDAEKRMSAAGLNAETGKAAEHSDAKAGVSAACLDAGQNAETGKLPVWPDAEMGTSAVKLAVFHPDLLNMAEQEGISEGEALDFAKSVGIDAVYLCWPAVCKDPYAGTEEIRRHALEISGVFDFYDFANSPEDEHYKEVIDFAARQGIGHFLAVPGNIDKGEHRQQDLKTLTDCMKNVCIYAAGTGVQVEIEDSDGDMPFCTDREMLWLLSRIPGLRLCFDTGNFVYGGSFLKDADSLLEKYITNYHMKDRAFRGNKASVVRSDGTALYNTAVGSGDLPIADILEKLKARGYRGYLNIEVFGTENLKTVIEDSAAYLTVQLRK